MPNNLINEKSPFLLRHAEDLVNWVAWGGDAFSFARATDRFVFLSIGNGASRWSETMRRECFADQEMAELMNSTCVCVLVDADERPDITGIFMDVCQIQNGGAGLPLSALLTPEGEPFFIATWLPKRSMASVPGLADVLPRSKWLWITQKENVYRSAKSLIDEIKSNAVPVVGGVPGYSQARMAFKELKKDFDENWGGFIVGGAPKTISAAKLIFLTDYAEKMKAPEAFEMVKKTLKKMWLGGIHDHIGGGFFESAIDERWIIPRFNKTLPDQALLLYVAAGVKDAALAEDVAGFMLGELLAPESGFYASIDANDEYYLWTEEELRGIIPVSDFVVFGQAFSIMRGGNFRHELTGIVTGQNVLYMNEDINDVASRFFSKSDTIGEKMSEIRAAIFERRRARSDANLNDQIFLAQNGIAAAALAFAGRVFDKKDWTLAAERALIFCQKSFPDPKGNWRRRYCDKEAGVDVQFCDLASLAWGAMELHVTKNSDGAKKDTTWLKFAENLMTKAEELFAVKHNGHINGFFATDGRDERITRRKLCADGEGIGENAIAVRVFLMLSDAYKIVDNKDDKEAEKERAEKSKKYRNLAKETAAAFSRTAAKSPSSFAALLGLSLKI